MTETDYEKLRRELREMEGKNISHYSVLLTAFIRTRVENSRMIAILSAAGIALMTMVLLTTGVHRNWNLFFTAAAFLAFLISLWISLAALEKSAESLMLSLKEGSDRDLDLDVPSCVAKKFFVLGCTCLVALGLLAVGTSKFKGVCCPVKKADMITDRTSMEAGNLKGAGEMKASDQVMPDPRPTAVGSQDPAVKTTTTRVSQASAGVSASQEIPKKAGNAGVFQRGVSK